MKNLLILLLVFFTSTIHAEVCQHIVDGDKLVNALSARNPREIISLDKNKNFSDFENSHLQVFYDAKEKLQKVANLSPRFIVCGDKAPNAFAFRKDGEDIVGVTVGMVNMINGDPDMAAGIMGHEFAHHTLNHRESMQTSAYITTFVTAIIGIALDVAINVAASRNSGSYNSNSKRKNVQPYYSTIGRDLSYIGAGLLLSKFSRDHEREADEQAYKYMTATGYDPEGFVRLSNLFTQRKLTSSGYFFDTHPHSEERAENIRKLIARSKEPEISSTSIASNTEINSSNISAIAMNSMQGNQRQSFNSKPFSFKEFFSIDKASDYEQKGIEALLQNNYPVAISHFEKASSMGHHTSSVILGNIYTKGEMATTDMNKAYKYYELASKHNVSAGIENLGLAYYHGRGVVRNEDKAYQLVKKASEKDPNARINLAYIEVDSEKYRNYDNALKIFQEFANAGNVFAQQNLGYMHMMGLGTKVDYDEALKYFKIAYQHVPFPGLSIAYMTENGLGVKKDPQEATRIYKELSDKGIADAHMFLGWKYYKGIDGVNQNHTEALRLFQLAEKNAKDYYIHRQALYGIGYVYFYSETNQNQNEGVKYMRQAAEKGEDLAKEFLKINNLS